MRSSRRLKQQSNGDIEVINLSDDEGPPVLEPEKMNSVSEKSDSTNTKTRKAPEESTSSSYGSSSASNSRVSFSQKSNSSKGNLVVNFSPEIGKENQGGDLECVFCAALVSRDGMESHLAAQHVFYFPFHCGICRDCFPTRKQLLEHFEDEGHSHQVLHNRDREKLNLLKSLMAQCEALAERKNCPELPNSSSTATLNVNIDEEVLDTDSASVAKSNSSTKSSKTKTSSEVEKPGILKRKPSTSSLNSMRTESKIQKPHSEITVAAEKPATTVVQQKQRKLQNIKVVTMPAEAQKYAKKSARMTQIIQERLKRDNVPKTPCADCDKVPLDKQSHAMMHMVKEINDESAKKRTLSKRLGRWKRKCWPPNFIIKKEPKEEAKETTEAPQTPAPTRRKRESVSGTPSPRRWCRECKKKVNGRKVEQHVLKVHLRKQILHCRLCDYRVTWEMAKMEEHFQKNHPGEEVKVIDDTDYFKGDINKFIGDNICSLDVMLATEPEALEKIPSPKNPKKQRRSSFGRSLVYCHNCAKDIQASKMVYHVYVHLKRDGFPRFQCMLEGCEFSWYDKSHIFKHVREFHKQQPMFEENVLDHTESLMEQFQAVKAECFQTV